MAKNSQFSPDLIEGGAQARSTDLAIIKRIVAIKATAKTRITKISIKAITIR
ncbi:hypothetical protein AWB79_06477 [Caballeronia hypogeia]|uniref:Uncharacterized protein n=1 Tax=Caballeronia hypogeia TaxID=1777140 RepID=A0A158D6F0_9BURK|nr:hypothetical protein [Caballeronia hypogeia]SAK89796.1 hypothetical protein AWB79_06477 [Caballeronia hypogeia]